MRSTGTSAMQAHVELHTYTLSQAKADKIGPLELIQKHLARW
jgi:hypothetical protein